jgi:thiol-disulfide isomerase/thioredoxin
MATPAPKKPANVVKVLIDTFLGLAMGVAVIFVVAAFLQSWLAQPGSSTQLPSGPDLPILGHADPDWALESLDGKKLTFGSFKGRTVFLNIWATWCGPCVGEIPSIQDLYDAIENDGVAVVLVSEEGRDKVRQFVANKNLHVPVYLAPEGMSPVFQTNGIPATFIINRRGEIVFQQVGSADWNSEDCRRLLRQLQKK